MTTRRLLASVLAGVLAAGTVALVIQTPPATAERRGHEPVVIGHRGASAHRPEHTLLSYETAIALGADYIEPDLVSTKDHVLVARHENEISGTTDVAAHPEFADRRTTKTVDGRPVTGWFTEDFTLAELKTLRAKERVPDLRPGNTAFDGLAEIPTFEEVVQLALRAGVGVYPETKHPTYFDSIGLSLEEPLLEVLDRYRVRKAYIQSFETANLRELSGRTKLPLIQLITFGGAPYDWVAAGGTRTYDDMVTPDGLREVARYADGIGVDTRRVVPQDAAGRTLPPTTLVADAHRRGLDVHVWTVRNENSQLPTDYRMGDPASPVYPRATGNVTGWLAKLLDLGVDGAFCDDPGTGRAVIAQRSR
ncbi:glycerophosphodiester phosphodiesterase [Actinomadura sp. ATCC 31491]|uniref:glycerophosphodiester phosphodiesterase n=1 Tax=Actinomadura luzonensis TaxID=2805427 RepID=A0ABT0G3I8_9ACTN|nr:glycerophosphodiester phosphodiesterase [Actinomadura luzonensis]MCK2219059.1 glycerophosphodiester phosphodiesterase [Actinomadura luzonensis]